MLLANGKVFFNGGIVEKDIAIENGSIQKIGHIGTSEREKQGDLINAGGMLILPGLVDVHVHMREPGDVYKEDFRTGSRAAIAGGITTVLDMPNNRNPTITAQRLEEKRMLAKKAICDVFFYMGAAVDNFNEIKNGRPAAIKMYISETTGKLLLNDAKAIAKHFKNFDRRISVHAEGRKKIERIITIAEANAEKFHLAHATTQKEVYMAKAIGGSVEVTPHHLFLSKKDEEKLGKLAPVKPPLHDEADRMSVWNAIDRIDCIATDHAPHTLEDKERGAYGFPGLETSLALMLNAYNKRMISLDAIVQKMAANPARLFGLNDRGEIAAGKKADLVLVDTREVWTVRGEELNTKCKWSPFDGWKLKGRAKKIIRNGNIVYENGEFFD